MSTETNTAPEVKPAELPTTPGTVKNGVKVSTSLAYAKAGGGLAAEATVFAIGGTHLTLAAPDAESLGKALMFIGPLLNLPDWSAANFMPVVISKREAAAHV